MKTLVLRPGRDRSVRRRHPWLFDGAIAKESGDEGDRFCVVDSSGGERLASGVLSPRASLRARLVRFDGEPLDEGWIRARVGEAVELRKRFVPAETDAYRVIHSEGDLIPGIIADVYVGVLVIQATTEGAEAIAPWVVDELRRRVPLRSIVHRRDSKARELERLPIETTVEGDPIPAEGIVIRERGIRFFVDPVAGQKTGFFLDQRENRRRVGELARGKSVLNVFAYSGGFGVAATAGGASGTVNVDISSPALELARRNFEANGFDLPPHAFVGADAFEWLRQARRDGRSFDVVILDPPAFVKSKGALDRGLRGYKDVNLQAMPLVRPGGLLFTFSCSGLVDAPLFQKVVFGAADDARVDFRLLERLGAGPDHPVLLACPETEYLKGLLLERIGVRESADSQD